VSERVSATTRRCFRLVSPRVRQDLYFAVRKVRPSVRAYVSRIHESTRVPSVPSLPSRSPCRGVKDSCVPSPSSLSSPSRIAGELQSLLAHVAGWTDRSRAIRPRDQVRTFNSNSNDEPRRMKVSPLSFPIGVLAWRLSIAEIHGRRDYWVYKLISCFKIPYKVADFFIGARSFHRFSLSRGKSLFCLNWVSMLQFCRLQISQAGAMLKFPSRNLSRQFLQVVKSFIAVSLPLLEFLVNSKLANWITVKPARIPGRLGKDTRKETRFCSIVRNARVHRETTLGSSAICNSDFLRISFSLANSTRQLLA